MGGILGGLLGGLIGPLGLDGASVQAAHGASSASPQGGPSRTEPSGKHGLRGILNKIMGGLMGPPSSGMPIPIADSRVGTEEQITEETKPDGRICRTTLVITRGKVEKNITQCSSPRRLQLEEDDLWLLGGVFLERYVVTFDFDHERIGFAEPEGGTNVAPVNLYSLDAKAARVAAASPNVASKGRAATALALAACGCAVLLGLHSWRAHRRPSMRGESLPSNDALFTREVIDEARKMEAAE